MFDHTRIDRDIFYGSSSSGMHDPARAPVHLDSDAYFCMGDNNPNSKDSRSWGFVRRGHIVGKAFMVFWPLIPWEVQLIR